MNASGPRKVSRSAGRGSACSSRASVSSMMLPSTCWPPPARRARSRSTPSSRRRTRRTSRGSSMRTFDTGTTAEASSRSTCTLRGTAMAVARSEGSATVRRPSGLSSRTTSPVSVTHAVVESPAKASVTRKAGTGRSPTRTTSRPPTSIVTGAFLIVAGSNIVHSWRAPAARPSLARRRARLSISAGGSASVRVSVRDVPPLVIVSESVRPFNVPLTETGPVPGSREKSNDRSSNARSTRAVVRMMAGVVAPRSDICRRPSSCSSNPSSVAMVWPTVKPIFSPR